MHLDFHTSEQITGIGDKFDPDEFAETLKAASVDSITCFSKCHHGMIYHDTKFIEAKHPHLTRNLLAEQIQACHARGIKVPIYISAGCDQFMDAKHPQWRQIRPDGSPIGPAPLEAGFQRLCFNSPYIDYLVKQTEEVLDIFGDEVDGLFFDIVAMDDCCCKYCIDGMLAEGYDPESEPDRRKYGAKTLDSFKEMMTSAIRRKNRKCGIVYNSGHVGPYIRNSLHSYTSLELESLPSGDWGYEHFPIVARYARNLNKEFIGMTGRFNKAWGDFGGLKNQAALEYECFSSLALGGGCSIGDQLHPSGKLSEATFELIGKVYSQVAKKEEWCKKSKPVVELAVITPESVENVYIPKLSESMSGVFRMLKETHYQFDVIDFAMDLAKYKVIILPDTIRLDSKQAEILQSYLNNGGKIVASYYSGMHQDGYDFILDNMPAKVNGESKMSPDFLVAEELISNGIPKSEHVMYERGLEFEPAACANILASVWNPYFERNYRHFCSHFHTPVDGPAGYPGMVANRSIVYIGYPIFGMYKRHGARVYRDMVINSLKLLLKDEDKIVQSNAPTTSDILLNYQPDADRYILHILHYIPERRYLHADTIEDVIPLHNIKVDLKLPDGYEFVEQVPERMKLDSTRVGKRLSFVIPSVNGHTMISIKR